MNEKFSQEESHDPSLITFSPQKVSSNAVEMSRQLQDHPEDGFKTGIAPLDKWLLPPRAGDLITVMGRPSNYKTGLMLSIAETQCQKIIQSGSDNEVAVYVTWETSVEEQGLMDISSVAELTMYDISKRTLTDDQWKRLIEASIQRMKKPLWVIGHSVLNRKKRPNLSLDDVARGLMLIEDEFGKKVTSVYLDYLQRIRPAEGESRDMRFVVDDNMNRSKNMGLALACPVFMGVQPGRHVDYRKFKLPTMLDGKESSSIEEVSDKMFTTWMPKNTEPLNKPCPVMKDLNVTEELLLIGIAKQKLASAQKIIPCWIDFKKNKIYEIDQSISGMQEIGHDERDIERTKKQPGVDY